MTSGVVEMSLMVRCHLFVGLAAWGGRSGTQTDLCSGPRDLALHCKSHCCQQALCL